jgi:hypothetical protein
MEQSKKSKHPKQATKQRLLAVPPACFPAFSSIALLQTVVDSQALSIDPSSVKDGEGDSSVVPSPTKPSFRSFSQLDRMMPRSSPGDYDTTHMDSLYSPIEHHYAVRKFLDSTKPCEPYRKELEQCRVRLKTLDKDSDREEVKKERAEMEQALLSTDTMYRYCLAEVTSPKRMRNLRDCWRRTPKKMMEAALYDTQIASVICKEEKDAVERCAGRQVQHVFRSSFN